MAHLDCSRWRFLLLVVGPLLYSASEARGEDSARPNVLLLTADDLGFSSLGVTGCPLVDVTPHLDELAAQGLLFWHAHVTVSVCQPCRQVLMTGRYPHNNGALGFEPIWGDVPTLQQRLTAASYLCGIIGKGEHLQPRESFGWAFEVASTSERSGREPADFYRYTRAFLEHARGASRPFFLMANTTDPHRPWPGTQREREIAARFNVRFPDVRQRYSPADVPLPAFLPDLPVVREEVAAYYTAVHRADECLGEVLRALADAGLQQQTLVMFLSDHGMAFPFAKGNCYGVSTRTPWIVRWPGKVSPGVIDRRHFISGIDFMPTILDALGLAPPDAMDGRSFLPLLEGHAQRGRDHVVTVYNKTTGKGRRLPMRCVRTREYSHIWNPWSDGTTVHSAASGGRTLPAMIQAAKRGNWEIAQRKELYLHRVREEFYRLGDDPHELNNQIDNAALRPALNRFRRLLESEMQRTADPLLAQFRDEVLPFTTRE